MHLITVDLSRKLGAGSKDSVVSRAADKLAHQPPSPERRPNRILIIYDADALDISAGPLSSRRPEAFFNSADKAVQIINETWNRL